MKLHFRGKFDGDNSKLPTRVNEKNSVKFDEAENIDKFSLTINIISLALTILLILFFAIYTGSIKNFDINGAILALVTIFPHEFLHASFFKADVYLYSNIFKGIIFVTGTENMSKTRAILMNLVPNLVFAFIPFLIFLMNKEMYLLGSMSVFTIAMGAGDYYNLINIIKQMPKGAYTYINGMSSYWFIPSSETKDI